MRCSPPMCLRGCAQCAGAAYQGMSGSCCGPLCMLRALARKPACCCGVHSAPVQPAEVWCCKLLHTGVLAVYPPAVTRKSIVV